MNILDQIVSNKKLEVMAAKKRLPLSLLKNRLKKVNFFQEGLVKTGHLQLIAEIKPKSPSAGVIRGDVDPKKLAQAFTRQGACSISVLTDKKYFGGDLKLFSRVRQSTGLPLLRKEFIVDPYQIYESKLAGANLVLLIASVLKNRVPSFVKLSLSLNLQPLIEVHNSKELKSVLRFIKASPKVIIGINNRDLDTLKIDTQTSLALIKVIPKEFIRISESGIFKTSQLKVLEKAGFDGVLVGTGLAKSPKLIQYFSRRS